MLYWSEKVSLVVIVMVYSVTWAGPPKMATVPSPLTAAPVASRYIQETEGKEKQSRGKKARSAAASDSENQSVRMLASVPTNIGASGCCTWRSRDADGDCFLQLLKVDPIARHVGAVVKSQTEGRARTWGRGV